MKDCYVYYSCVSGHCPRIIKEEIYGVTISTCNDYGCNKYNGCDNCYFDSSDICNDCIHRKDDV